MSILIIDGQISFLAKMTEEGALGMGPLIVRQRF